MNFNNLIDKYDPASGLYFKSITAESKPSRFSKSSPKIKVVNIGIFNPITDEIVTIFPKDKSVSIDKILFELKYREKLASIEYNDDVSHNIRNNVNIEKRRLNNKLLISTEKDDRCTLWKSDKDGKNLKVITTVLDKDSWHLDVKNSKIRVISSTEGTLSVKSFPW